MRRSLRIAFLLLILLAVFSLVLPSQTVVTKEKVDLEVLAKIREEGLERSQVMEHIFYLSDVYGARITGSPALRGAMNWCVESLKGWGLENACLEPHGDIGPGWSVERVSLHMLEPVYAPLAGYPQAWTAGTDGIVKGEPVLIRATSEADLEQYKGKLKGRIVLAGAVSPVEYWFAPQAYRYTQEQLDILAGKAEPKQRREREFDVEKIMAEHALLEKLHGFLGAEGVAVLVEPSGVGDGKYIVNGTQMFKTEEEAFPIVNIEKEQFNRIARLLEHGIAVTLEIEVRARFHGEDTTGYNVVAEIPGTDPALKDEVVMLGGHMDGCPAATAATDNAAGAAVCMEAVRILKAIGVEPRRTIRISLWDGEEEGFWGSAGYVEKHFGEEGAFTPEYEKLSVYFNYDNGSGKIRGVYAQDNKEAVPIFDAWLEPLNDLGATTVSPGMTGGTDHISFDNVSLPAFQFIQDPLAYMVVTHHTNVDDYDHCVEEDLEQSAVVMASFVYNAAMRDERFPRKPPLEVVELDQAAKEAVAGEYQVLGMSAVVTIDNGAMFLEVGNFPKAELLPLSETEFIAKGFGVKVTFVKDAGGVVTGVAVDMGGRKITGQKVK